MKQIYLSHLYFLLASTIFAVEEAPIAIADSQISNPNLIVNNTEKSTNKYISIIQPFKILNTLPTQPLNPVDCTSQFIEAKSLDPVQKLMMKYLEDPNQPNRSSYVLIHNKRKKMFQKNSINQYMTFCLTPDRPLYSFSWEKKSYKDLTSTEREIANYYKADHKSKIELLYPYNSPNTDPWAIKINDKTYATIWLEAQSTNLDQLSLDTFLLISGNTSESVSILIDQAGGIIAKRIGNQAIFRK